MDPKLMTPEELEAVRARSPIEPWPANVWEGEMGGWCAVGPHRKRGDEDDDEDCFVRAEDDARWVESARTDIPRLLSHIAALEKELKPHRLECVAEFEVTPEQRRIAAPYAARLAALELVAAAVRRCLDEDGEMREDCAEEPVAYLKRIFRALAAVPEIPNA